MLQSANQVQSERDKGGCGSPVLVKAMGCLVRAVASVRLAIHEGKSEACRAVPTGEGDQIGALSDGEVGRPGLHNGHHHCRLDHQEVSRNPR